MAGMSSSLQVANCVQEELKGDTHESFSHPLTPSLAHFSPLFLEIIALELAVEFGKSPSLLEKNSVWCQITKDLFFFSVSSNC